MPLVDWLTQALQSHGELALFLSLGLGYALGKLRHGSFKVGPVLGCLIAGVLVGQLDVPVSRDLKYAFYLLFLVAIGYKTGPQFFSGLKSSGLPQTGLTVFLCGTGLATAWLVATLFGGERVFVERVRQADGIRDSTADVVVEMTLTSRALAGRTIREVGSILGEKSRSIFLRQVTRAGNVLPSTLETVLERGDVLTIVGSKNNVERLAPEIGLSLAVGVLLGGLVAGWLRSMSHRFGRVPEPALWLFDSVGLNAFLALVAAGFLVCAIPHIATILLGRYVLKMHPGILLGVCAGAGTSAPALAAVQDKARSTIPTLGYGVSYAVGNVLLALWGTVIVLLMTG